MSRFVYAEPRKCIACRTCEAACANAHADAGRAEGSQPVIFPPRLKVMKEWEVSMPVQCRQCEKAPCVSVCPNGAIGYVAGTVQVDEELCNGCKTCVMACPFGAMEMVAQPLAYGYAGGVKAKAQKCDLCIDRKEGPACVAVCPTKALHFVDIQAMGLC